MCFGFCLKHDLGQVVDDMAAGAAELHQGCCGIDRVANCKEREIEARGPPLSALLEDCDRVGCKIEAEASEHLCGFVLGETELGRTKLEQPAARAQACEREWWVHARRHDQLCVRRAPLDQDCDRLVAGWAGNPVIVVEDEDDLAIHGLELVQDSRDDGIERHAASRAQRRLERTCEARLDAADRRDQVVPEKQRIVVLAIERDPGKRTVVQLLALREQHRLAEAGRGNDENHRHTRRRHSLRKPPPRHDLRTKNRRMKLAAQESGAHGE